MRTAIPILLAVLCASHAAGARAGFVSLMDPVGAQEQQNVPREARSVPREARRTAPNDPAGFEVVWSGTYNVSDMRRIDDANAPAGSRGVVLDYHAPAQDRATTRIPARVGNNFGVAFTFRGASEETPVDYRAVWRFPLPGLTNPKNGKTFLRYESSSSVCRGGVCVYGWSLSEPWEMVTGTWFLELWRGSSKLHEQRFEVVRP